jgi:hypothetical protein
MKLIHHLLVDGVANLRSIQLHDHAVGLPRNQDGGQLLGLADGCRHDQETRSTIRALPWPTPTHIVASP